MFSSITMNHDAYFYEDSCQKYTWYTCCNDLKIIITFHHIII